MSALARWWRRVWHCWARGDHRITVETRVPLSLFWRCLDCGADAVTVCVRSEYCHAPVAPRRRT